MPSRSPGGGGWKPSQRQVEEIKKLRDPSHKKVVVLVGDKQTIDETTPVAWSKLAVHLFHKYGVQLSGERVRTVSADIGIETSDGRKQHVGNVLPWKTVLQHHQASSTYRMLKRYSYRLQGRDLPDSEAGYLDDWLRWMNGANEWGTALAVHYDRDGGWVIRRRRDGEDGPISPPPQLQVVR